MTFADRQRARRAAGQTGTALFLDRLEAQSPPLREYAEDVVGRRAVMPDPSDPVAVAGAIRRAIGDLRLQKPRRALAEELAVELDDPLLERRRRERVVEITQYLRDHQHGRAVRAWTVVR